MAGALRLLAVALVATGCGIPQNEPTGRATSAVTNATSDGDDPGVVAIVGSSGTAECSGTLIAPHLVLTAGHCTGERVIAGAAAVFGSSTTSPAASIPIVLAIPHPQFDPASLANDVAILVLGSAGPAAPVALGTAPPTVGSEVRVVGFGYADSDGGGLGQKRQGTSLVSSIDSTTFDLAPDPSQPCEGDSGGPALASTAGVDYVVGVTSHGDGACVAMATDSRVDAYVASFITPTMTAYADGTALPGQPCLFPERCEGGAPACVVAPDDPNVSYCTTDCAVNADCPTGMICASIGASGSQCRYPTPTPGAPGASCSTDADCVDTECTETGVCAVRCVPGEACAGSFSCTNTGGIDFFCLATAPPTATGGCSLGPPRAPRGGPPACVAAWLAVYVVRRRFTVTGRPRASPRSPR